MTPAVSPLILSGESVMSTLNQTWANAEETRGARFWEVTIGLLEIPTDDFVGAFVEGALEVFEEVADKL